MSWPSISKIRLFYHSGLMYMVQIQATEYWVQDIWSWVQGRWYRIGLLREKCSYATKPSHISNCRGNPTAKRHLKETDLSKPASKMATTTESGEQGQNTVPDPKLKKGVPKNYQKKSKLESDQLKHTQR